MKPNAPLLLALATLATPLEAQTRVTIDSGVIEGEANEQGLRLFRGIPYAAPPVGTLRWRPPQPVLPWEGVRPARAFGPACPQGPLIAMLSGEPPPKTDEDCLSLNLWTTAPGDEARLPVLVWIHGGGFTGGWSSQRAFDGAPFAHAGLVFVSINYRLGPLGFLALPELSAESEHGASGNQGLLDQVAALQWIQRNVARFGGDPARVTICGESAGATSVLALCASRLTSGLFHGAIAMSPWVTVTNALPLAEAEARGAEFVQRLIPKDSQRTLAALRALPPEDVWRRLGARFEPILAVDGWSLTDYPEDVFGAGKQHRVPLLIGTTADEGTVFVGAFPYNSIESYEAGMHQTYGPVADDILARYPVLQYADLPGALTHFVTEEWFTRPARKMLSGAARVGTAAWQYVFGRANPALPALGAHHAVEIPYLFHAETPALSPDDAALAEALFATWVRFAKTGTPAGEALPEWPAWTLENQDYLRLDVPIATGRAWLAERCDALEELRTIRLEEAEEH